jgi:hypothetical protein
MKSELDLLIEEIKRGEWNKSVKPKDAIPECAPTGVCWHCGGSALCSCSSCGVMQPTVSWHAGPCIACQARARKSKIQ